MKKAEIIKNGHLNLENITSEGIQKELSSDKLTAVSVLTEEIIKLKKKITELETKNASLEAENSALQDDNDDLRNNRTG